ncbi:MAG: alanine/glycine:cation symporter family protein [Thermovenabulum sp.]|uniref:alanine/glycine:cation symporter family protein n=1 Tax=Thermovenabulum sp. TaxID=3100335 RepID=UPI003C7A7EFC
MEKFLETLSGLLWGKPLIYTVLFVGLFFTIGSGFWQFKNIGYILKNTLGKIGIKSEGQEGILTPFQAVSVALAGTIGVGNIAGVASAIAVGGPGAVFWMWVCALVGMMTKMVEVTLAVHYRDKNPDGSTYGGPTYYMEKGLGIERGFKYWKPLAVLFGVGIFSTFFITLQNYTVCEAINTTFKIPMLIVGLVYIILTYIVILGGIKKVGEVSSYVVPFMALFYIIGGLFIILSRFSDALNGIALIFKSAFSGTAAVGGFAGATISKAMQMGVARSIYSNEAGWGTAPMAHSTAKTDHPVRQGLWGAFEVFMDTIVVCSITALVIITTGMWSSGASGASLTLSAFEKGLGFFGKIVVTIGIFLFGWSTTTGWYAYYEIILRHLMKGKEGFQKTILTIYKYLYPIPGFLMVVFAVTTGLPPAIVWLLADVTSAVPTFVNLIVILILAPRFFELLHDFNAREFKDKTGKTLTKLFYED